MNYVLYWDGEFDDEFDCLEAVRERFESIRADFILDEKAAQATYPDDYPPEYNFDDAFNDWARDVLEVKQTVDLEQFLG